MDPRRVWRVALLLALVVSGENARGQAQETTLIVQSSPLAGFRYHAAAEVWQELRVGDRLELKREPDNPHDANAVSVCWRGHKLGYLPRRDNAAASWTLDRGQRLSARISKLAQHPNPARRIEVEVYAE